MHVRQPADERRTVPPKLAGHPSALGLGRLVGMTTGRRSFHEGRGRVPCYSSVLSGPRGFHHRPLCPIPHTFRVGVCYSYLFGYILRGRVGPIEANIYSHPSTQRPGIRSLHIPTPTSNLVPTYPHILTCHNTRAALATDGTLAVAWRPSGLSL